MIFNETYYTNAPAQFSMEKVAHYLVELVNTYYFDSFFNADQVIKDLNAVQHGSWFSNQIQIKLDFRKSQHIQFEADCPVFTVEYRYETSDSFPNGFHYVNIDEKHGESLSRAFIDFIDKIKTNFFEEPAEIITPPIKPQEAAKVKEPIKIRTDENGKTFAAIDLNYYNENPITGDSANLYVNDRGVHWGIQGPPQVTMSASSGAGGVISFQEFMAGELDSFILTNFSAKVLEEVKKNVALRLS